MPNQSYYIINGAVCKYLFCVRTHAKSTCTKLPYIKKEKLRKIGAFEICVVTNYLLEL